ncbi:MAG: ArsC/Spx/MgsR family protein [Microthrixaceae bacterium]
MSEIIIFHNPGCSTSKYAVEVAEQAGVDYRVVKYMLKAERPNAEQLNEILDKLEDPATDLVRRDANFTKLGLTEQMVQTRQQVLEVLLEHPALLQRPILVSEDLAIIGRPKTRVPTFLGV